MSAVGDERKHRRPPQRLDLTIRTVTRLDEGDPSWSRYQASPPEASARFSVARVCHAIADRMRRQDGDLDPLINKEMTMIYEKCISGKHIPVPWLMLRGFRSAFFRSFLGRMVSVLGLSLTLPPSLRGPVDRSPAVRPDCGIDCTVSVSTVIFCFPSAGRTLVDVSGKAGFVFGRLCRCDRCVGALLEGRRPRVVPAPSLLFPALSLPLSVGCCRSPSAFSVFDEDA